jgi:hypothetical protein
MRADAHQLESGGVLFSVDEKEVGLEMAIAKIGPRARKRMIEVAVRQRCVYGEQIDRRHQHHVEGLAVRPRQLPFVVSPEPAGVSNRPHSALRAACPVFRP